MLSLSLVMVAGFFIVSNQVHRYLEQPVMIEQAEIIVIPSGATLTVVLQTLLSNNWISHSSVSSLIRRFHPELTRIKAGTFQIQPNLTLEQTLLSLINGKEHQFTITFIEGSRFKDWRKQLEEAPYLTKELTELSEAQIAAQLKIDHDRLEGLFLAETYYYTAGTSDLELLKRAYVQLMAVLQPQWQNRPIELPLNSAYEALILASIVEKETAIASERTRIAGVFINRLNRKMRLQTDPTVIYGMGERYDGNIRKQDLKAFTPYNTYVIDGLPPTPIAMPGKASIEATLNPEKSQYLYFVANGQGGHQFSMTLAEHNRAVSDYLKQLKKNNR